MIRLVVAPVNIYHFLSLYFGIRIAYIQYIIQLDKVFLIVF